MASQVLTAITLEPYALSSSEIGHALLTTQEVRTQFKRILFPIHAREFQFVRNLDAIPQMSDPSGNL